MGIWMCVRSQREVLVVLRDSFYLAKANTNTEASHATADRWSS